MAESELKPGDPYCTNCGYALTGAVDSSKCPECGLPLVEIMDRHRVALKYAGKRYRSTTTLFGLPLIDIALGPVEDEPKGKAKGFIAIGDIATGWLAIGGFARGFVTIGGMSIGCFSMGGMSLGLFTSLGGCSFGGLAAGGFAGGGLCNGGGALGYVAQGGGSFGIYARGGGAIGVHTIGGSGGTSQEAIDMFSSLSWFFGGSGLTFGTMLYPFLLVFLITLGMAALMGMMGWLKWSKHGPGDVARFP